MTEFRKEQLDFAKRELAAADSSSAELFAQKFWRGRIAFLESDEAPALGCRNAMKPA